MPQLDVTWFPTQLIWLALTFIALYLVIAGVAAPRISAERTVATRPMT